MSRIARLVAMILRATLLTLMLAALGLVAFTPSASATCIDATPDDNGVGTQGCSTPVAGNCKVLVYGQTPGFSPGCSPITCVRDCIPIQCFTDPCW
jgi:hypothetical protein